ncbi:MAG: Smr/MutS family protein [Planctomycetia bacterium]|nr:Smr/MutS family protein [Planctomycetia bacterium]
MQVFTTDAKIDLHGFTPEAALYRLERLCESGSLRGKSLLVIHGQGHGILRDKVRQWGKESRMIKKIWPGEEYFLPGGGGVTVFYL